MDPSTRRALADWTRAQPAVSAFVHALVHDRAERDDVLQDVAVAVLESHHRHGPSRPFLAWALTIARNEVVDSLRRRRRRPALLGPDAADALAGAIADVADGERARLAHLADSMSELDRRAREACEPRYRAGRSNAQVAHTLGLQANTASKLLQRVRERLRECIEPRHRREARA